MNVNGTNGIEGKTENKININGIKRKRQKQ